MLPAANVNNLILILLGVLLCLPQPVSFASEEKSENNQYGLESCHDKKLRVGFLCNPGWGYQLVEDGLLVVIASDPIVTVTFARIDSEISRLPKLNKSVLMGKNLYQKGFRRELTTLNDQDVVIVRAFSKKNPDRRVLDHFFIHEDKLFGVLFSVSPKVQWDEYKFLIKEVADSIMLYKDGHEGE